MSDCHSSSRVIKKESEEEEIDFDNDEWLRQHNDASKTNEKDSESHILPDRSWFKNCVKKETEKAKIVDEDQTDYEQECILGLPGPIISAGKHLNERNYHQKDYSTCTSPSTSVPQFERTTQRCSYQIEKNQSSSVTSDDFVRQNSSDTQDVHGSVENKVTVSAAASTGLCSFQCNYCCVTHNTWNRFMKHMEKEHGKTIEMQEYEAYLFEAVHHLCKICQNKVLCDTSLLTDHFRDKHDMSLNDYRVRYNCGISPEEKLKETLDDAKFSSDNIGDLCTFVCSRCFKTCKSLNFLKTHGHGNLNRSCIKQPKLNFWLECIEEAVTHICKICSKDLLCDTTIIQDHMSKNHGIRSLKEYSQRAGLSFPPKRASGAENSFPKDSNITRHVGNFCRYTCKVCKHDTKTWLHMRNHLKTTNHAPYGSKNVYQHLSVAIFHTCVICTKKVLNDSHFVENHALSCHQLTLNLYVKKIKDKN